MSSVAPPIHNRSGDNPGQLNLTGFDAGLDFSNAGLPLSGGLELLVSDTAPCCAAQDIASGADFRTVTTTEPVEAKPQVVIQETSLAGFSALAGNLGQSDGQPHGSGPINAAELHVGEALDFSSGGLDLGSSVGGGALFTLSDGPPLCCPEPGGSQRSSAGASASDAGSGPEEKAAPASFVSITEVTVSEISKGREELHPAREQAREGTASRNSSEPKLAGIRGVPGESTRVTVTPLTGGSRVHEAVAGGVDRALGADRRDGRPAAPMISHASQTAPRTDNQPRLFRREAEVRSPSPVRNFSLNRVEREMPRLSPSSPPVTQHRAVRAATVTTRLDATTKRDGAIARIPGPSPRLGIQRLSASSRHTGIALTAVKTRVFQVIALAKQRLLSGQRAVSSERTSGGKHAHRERALPSRNAQRDPQGRGVGGRFVQRVTRVPRELLRTVARLFTRSALARQITDPKHPKSIIRIRSRAGLKLHSLKAAYSGHDSAFSRAVRRASIGERRTMNVRQLLEVSLVGRGERRRGAPNTGALALQTGPRATLSRKVMNLWQRQTKQPVREPGRASDHEVARNRRRVTQLIKRLELQLRPLVGYRTSLARRLISRCTVQELIVFISIAEQLQRAHQNSRNHRKTSRGGLSASVRSRKRLRRRNLFHRDGEPGVGAAEEVSDRGAPIPEQLFSAGAERITSMNMEAVGAIVDGAAEIREELVAAPEQGPSKDLRTQLYFEESDEERSARSSLHRLRGF